MSKKGVSAVSGVITPIIGEKYTYQIAAWYPDTPSSRRDPAKVTWELFRKRSNGKFTTTNIKKKGDSSFTFGQTALGNTYRLEGYLDHAEGGGLIIKPKTDKIPRITKVELFYVDDSKGSTFSFREKLRTKADCVNMFNKELVFTLWEDDAKNPGHNKNNKPIATKTKKVDKNGVAIVEFTLTQALMRKAMEGEVDPKQLEFYVTVEYYVHKKHSTENKNIDNPFPTTPSSPQVPSRSETPRTPQTPTPSAPTLPPNNSEPSPVPKAEGSPAEQKPPSKKEENGIVDVITESVGDLWDWAESIGTIIKDQLPTPTIPEGQSPAIIKDATVEGLLDAYFAKEEYTKETNENAGNYTYKFIKDNARVNKDEIAGIIKGKITSSLKAEKKYVKLEDIKNALPSSYTKNSTISFATYKLGAEYKRINSAPLEDEVYVVVQTIKLDGKQVTIQIKEKEAVLVGASANVSVLEAKENGNELTELKAIAQDGIAKVKVKLRPKTDEDLKKWKEKLQGVKDGSLTYTFGGNNDTSTEAKKKSVAQVIVGKVKQQLASSNKFAKAEDIAAVLSKTAYAKNEQVTFDVYKTITEQWWLKAECTGEKKHEGEFLKKEGAYFIIGGGVCECEARVRAFLRMLRVGEGTGELVKSRDKETKQIIYIAQDFEQGYTTAFGGSKITDLSDHPRINYGGSTAAGAYQVMKNTWDDPQYASNKTKYNINSFSKENQDKFSVLLMKHHPGCSDLLDLLLNGQTENSIRGRGSRIWASLPEEGDNSRYTFKGRPQPVTPMKTNLEHFERFLKDELAGNSPLHLKSGFLKEFGYDCCGAAPVSNGTCPEDCSQCFEYADVWDNPKLNNQSNNVNKNRFHRAKRVNSTYPNGYYHTGVDILSGGVFKDLHSLLCGEVVEPLVKSFKSEEYQANSIGNIVTIKSKDKNGIDVWIQYCHLDSVSVKVGDKIKHGQKIGVSGCTGNAGKKPNGSRGIEVRYWHVHIEASRENKFYGSNKRIDPEQFMKTKFDETTQGSPITN